MFSGLVPFDALHLVGPHGGQKYSHRGISQGQAAVYCILAARIKSRRHVRLMVVLSNAARLAGLTCAHAAADVSNISEQTLTKHCFFDLSKNEVAAKCRHRLEYGVRFFV